MKLSLVLGVTCALVMHAGFLLFGGLLVGGKKKDHASLQQVELLSDDETAQKEKPPEPPAEEAKVIEAETEQPPDATKLIENLERSAAESAPELEAASLSAIEAALSGQAGSGGDFAQSLDFSSGGRIGGSGHARAGAEKIDDAFSLAEIDQKPRAVYQTAPQYPADQRTKKVEAVVTVVFIVDAAGKVQSPRVEKSTNPSFEKPALEAVRQWKFEPGLKAGQRVSCKMRVPIRFQPS